MTSDARPDITPEPESGVSADDLVQLTVHVGLRFRPMIRATNNSTKKLAMTPGPPFIRFPVQVSAKDTGVLQQILDGDIGFVAFEIQERDSKPGYYRLVTVPAGE